MAMREDRQESRQIPLFSLAETVSVSSTQTESSHGIVPRSDGVRSKRWLRRGSDAFTSLPAVRCRSDWKDTLVQSSASARQQLGALIKLGPEVSYFWMQLTFGEHCSKSRKAEPPILTGGWHM